MSNLEVAEADVLAARQVVADAERLVRARELVEDLNNDRSP